MNEYGQLRRFSEVADRARPSQLPTDHFGCRFGICKPT